MRALLIVLDHLGVGHVPEGGVPVPDTLGRLLNEVPDLELPTLFSLGLGEIMKNRVFDPPARKCAASYGRMIQRSAGADALSGLWELAGVILGCPFTAADQLPAEFTAALSLECGVEFLLNPSDDGGSLLTKPAGKEPVELAELRKEHLRTGNPILTLRADSHLHIAAHESTIPAARFTHICRIARKLCDTWRVARVTGQSVAGKPDAWKPACPAFNLSMVPPRTLLNAISDSGMPVEAVGTINEAFARSGITCAHPTASCTESLSVIEQLWNSPQNGMIFANLGNFADVPCCGNSAASGAESARTLAVFDEWLGRFLEEIESDNLLIITGSNGMENLSLGPDRPRQEIPVLVCYGGRTAPLGIRETCADVAATLAAFFGLEERGCGWPVGEPLITFHRPRGFAGP